MKKKMRTTVLPLFLFYFFALTFLPLRAEFIEIYKKPSTVKESIRQAPIDTPTSLQLQINDLAICRSINVELLRNVDKTRIKISWIPPNIKDDLILARSHQPISTNEQFLQAETVAVLQVGTAFYIEENPQPGKYYYAIALRSHIRKGEIKLYGNENYTVFPINFLEQETPRGNVPPRVTGLRAELLDAKRVHVQWKSLADEDVIYVVYRSGKPLASPQSLASAEIIALIANSKNFFVDETLSAHGHYYYAVTARNRNGFEDRNLVPAESYTIDPILYGITESAAEKTPAEILPQPKESFPQLISFAAYPQPNGKKIHLVWKADFSSAPQDELASNANTLAYIYRFYKKPMRFQDIGMGNLIAKVPYGQGVASDTPQQQGLYYYAIFFQTGQGMLPKSFIEKGNLIGPIASVATDVPEVSQEKSFEPAPVVPEAKEKATTVVETPSSLPQETYQPTLSQETHKEAPLSKKETVQPSSSSPLPEDFSRLDNIIRQTYLHGNYQDALYRLQPYLESTHLPSQALAKYYSGLSLFRLGKFSQAASFFRDPLVQKGYKGKAEFWYQRSMEHVR